MSQMQTDNISRLNSVLKSPDLVLPVFVRFQTEDQYLTIPVVSVDLNGTILDINTGTESIISIQLERLVDIVAFCDASGKPVFLTDLFAGGQYANESAKETNDGIVFLLKHQYEYRKRSPICPERETPNSRRQEIEVENYDIKIRNGIMLAA